MEVEQEAGPDGAPGAPLAPRAQLFFSFFELLAPHSPPRALLELVPAAALSSRPTSATVCHSQLEPGRRGFRAHSLQQESAKRPPWGVSGSAASLRV